MPLRRILIVDDDPDIVVYLSSFLEDQGYELQSASDCSTALTVLGEFHPDVVLVDVLLPGRSGLDLLVRLRQDPRYEDIPIVVVTGNDKIVEDECKSYLGTHQGVAGPDGVLAKPVDQAALMAVVERLTAGSS